MKEQSPEKQLSQALLSPDYLVLCGSRLYGSHTEESDYDYRGFVVPPFDYLIGLNSFKDGCIAGNKDTHDHKVYSLKRFIDLVMNGDPLCTEILFAPKEFITEITPIGQEILDNRHLLLSNRIYRRMLGYHYSEWRKAFAQKMVIEDRTKTEDNIIADIRNLFSPDKASMDEIVEILMVNKKKVLVHTTRKLGAKRKEQIKKFGYVASSASHAIRLLGQLSELLLTGKITFPRPNTDLLRNVKLGKLSIEEVTEVYEECKAKAEVSRGNSILPNKPNAVGIKNIYKRIVIEKVKNHLSGE